MHMGKPLRMPRGRTSNISVWFVSPPTRGHSGRLNRTTGRFGRPGLPRTGAWRDRRSWHKRWPKPPSTRPFSHRCSSLRSVCCQDDYIFDDHGSLFPSEDASAILDDDDDVSWLNVYGSNDALFPGVGGVRGGPGGTGFPGDALPRATPPQCCMSATSDDGSRWASGCDVLSASELPLLCKHGR